MNIARHFDRYCKERTASIADGFCHDLKRLTKCEQKVRTSYPVLSGEQAEWVLQHLGEQDKLLFISIVLEGVKALDERFFSKLVSAGVNEVDPSRNKYLILPAVQHFGARRVMEQLLNIVKTGTPFEQAGAINALYWAQVPLILKPGAKEHTFENATPESQEQYLKVADISREIADYLLELFVSTDSVDVQCSIIPRLSLRHRKDDSDSHRQRVQQAIDIARSHENEYVRHRVEVQLGHVSVFQALPHRTSKPQDS